MVYVGQEISIRVEQRDKYIQLATCHMYLLHLVISRSFAPIS